MNRRTAETGWKETGEYFIAVAKKAVIWHLKKKAGNSSRLSVFLYVCIFVYFEEQNARGALVWGFEFDIVIRLVVESLMSLLHISFLLSSMAHCTLSAFESANECMATGYVKCFHSISKSDKNAQKNTPQCNRIIWIAEDETKKIPHSLLTMTLSVAYSMYFADWAYPLNKCIGYNV